MATRYTTLLIDADETIFDFLKGERTALRKVLKDRGLPHGDDVLERYHWINDALWHAFERGEITKEQIKHERFASLAVQSGFPADLDIDKINADYLAQLGESDFLLPGAEQFLRKLKKGGFDLVLITNGVARTQLRRLEKAGSPPCSAMCSSRRPWARKSRSRPILTPCWPLWKKPTPESCS